MIRKLQSNYGNKEKQLLHINNAINWILRNLREALARSDKIVFEEGLSPLVELIVIEESWESQLYIALVSVILSQVCNCL